MTRMLRSVPCASPLRIARRRAAAVVLQWALRTATRVVPAAVTVWVLGSACTNHVVREFGGTSKADFARHAAIEYAHVAYPRWRARHRTGACPERLEELNEYTFRKDIQDPWGSEYRVLCTGRGILVVSQGEDMQLGTADDVTSLR